MKLADIIFYSLKSLRHRQVRSWLTILGIVVGIAAVVSLLNIGQGFSAEVNRQLGRLGANTLFITPLAESQSSSAGLSPSLPPSAGKLYQKDVDRLRRIAEIEDIARLAMGRATIEFKGKEITATVQGIEPGVFEKTTDIGMREGRFLLDSDRHVAVLGANIADDTFGQNRKAGANSYILINGVKFRVIGVIAKTGGGFGPAARLDNAILVHFDDARQMFSEQIAENEIGAMAVLVQEGADVADVTEKIKLELDSSHKVKPDERDYSVVSPASIQQTIGSVIALVTVFLGAIASISLIVGGLSIANGMLASVLERTHEIGVLKAIGATQEDILRIFLLESGAVGAIGGIAGSLLGIGIVTLARLLVFPVQIDWPIVIFGVVFAFVIGIASGYLPAKKAASMNPVDALRYE
ncbi:MAG: ABC transporter permease [Candidatus Anstonellaceae archaeon]